MFQAVGLLRNLPLDELERTQILWAARLGLWNLDTLSQGGFFDRTPLWFYLLKEAEVRANGNSLGEVGSRIVAETIIGQLRHDPDSYLNHSWTLGDGVRLPNGAPIATIRNFIQFAGIPA